ncbi:MAG: hypothetical protein LBP34_00335 [Flavobacteriaceae bacterium]|jgi:hypothetical protein|nr:hypothetical protein [Flavobacteriaceae bacterium]
MKIKQLFIYFMVGILGFSSLISCVDNEDYSTPPIPPEGFFKETFTNCQKSDGSSLSSPWPKIADVIGFDGGASVKYSDPFGNADVRSTAALGSHVWFPAGKESSLVITGINTDGHSKIRLSYSIRTNNSAASNVNILKVKCNGVDLTIPPLTVSNSGYRGVSIPDIPSSSPITLEFSTTAELNTVGIRLDDIKIADIN